MIKQTNLFDALIEHPECKTLILHKNSGMGLAIQVIEEQVRFAKSVNVWLYFEDSKLVAWAWLFRRKNQVKRFLSFFVFCDQEARKKGVGRELFYQAQQLARKKHRRMVTYPWDFKSTRFYTSLKVPYRNQLNWII